MMQFQSDIFNVVSLDLCVGCGACAGVCPGQHLSMHTNQYGELRPAASVPCTSPCGKCSSICPMLGANPSKEDLAYDLFDGLQGAWSKETGFVHQTFVGHRNDGLRMQCASGGLASWMLEALFNAGLIKQAACVVPTGNPEQLFAYAVLNRGEEVRRSSGSAYYPVHLSEVIRHMLDNPGPYAVTGLPCFVKALRLAQKQNAPLRERIKFVLGITCGQMKSKHYTAYLATCAGLAGRPDHVNYRGKSPDMPANNYLFACHDRTHAGRNLFWNAEPCLAWTNRWFTPQACGYCDDVFSELADATFMDAWLPEYVPDGGGTSLVVVRNPRLAEILEKGVFRQTITASPIALGKVIQSQAGVLDYKRRQLMDRIKLAEADVRRMILNREEPVRPVPPLARWRIRNSEAMRITSRQAFRYTEEGRVDVAHLHACMAQPVRQQGMINRFDRLGRILRRIQKPLLELGRGA